MDVFAHGLWGAAAYATINKKRKTPLSMRWAALWSVFPDVFAFAPAFMWLAWNLVFGALSFAQLPHPDAVEPAQHDTLYIFRLTSQLYHFSHSLIVFFIVFAVAHALMRRPVWEMGGWLLHILIDIPTHSYRFYPTPFLWPLSGVMIDGVPWATPWFMILNYASLAVVYYMLFVRLRKKRQMPRVS